MSEKHFIRTSKSEIWHFKKSTANFQNTNFIFTMGSRNQQSYRAEYIYVRTNERAFIFW